METSTESGSEMPVVKISYKKLYKDKCAESRELKKRLRELEEQIKLLNKKCESLEKPRKGRMCSVNGGLYERQVHRVVRDCEIDGRRFNTQTEEELGGSSAKNDIECNFIENNDIGIEVKKPTPDWMQCSIKRNTELNRWEPSKRGKIPEESSKLFGELLNSVNLYNGKIPPFMERRMTKEEWSLEKEETNEWDDDYVDIPEDTIQKLYSMKGCQYIQISEYGLYHLGDDICGFGVPEFRTEQRMRIRIKPHGCRADGSRSLSVIAACQPKDIKSLTKSQYSLDDKNKLPPSLTYVPSQ